MKMRLLLILLLSLARVAAAEDPLPVTAEEKADQLATIQRELQWLQQTLQEKRRELPQLTGDEADEAREEIEGLAQRLARARVSFVATISDVELPTPEDQNKKPAKRDLLQEAQQLVEPLFDAIRRVSEKPRRIEAFRTRLAQLASNRDQIDRAIAGLQANAKVPALQPFQASVQDTMTELHHQHDELSVQIDMLDRTIRQESGNPVSVAQFLRGEVREFFATKGRDFFIALFVFFGVLWGLFHLRKVLLQSRLLQSSLRGFYKPVQALYGIAAVFVAMISTVAALHFMNDWFMATIVMLLFFGMLWGMRSLLQHFVHEVKLALNLGTVKEGERIFWNGVPWRIQQLGFRSVLQNDDLQGGRIHVPASALSSLLSREPYPGEPWFPTRVGDFVQLNDGTTGCVEVQTPGTVVVNSSGARKHFGTAEFLALNPQNFSRGFEATADLRLQAPAPASAEGVERAVAAHLQKCFPQAFSQPPKPTVRIVPLDGTTVRAWARLDCPGILAGDRDALRWELKVAVSAALRSP